MSKGIAYPVTFLQEDDTAEPSDQATLVAEEEDAELDAFTKGGCESHQESMQGAGLHEGSALQVHIYYRWFPRGVRCACTACLLRKKATNKHNTVACTTLPYKFDQDWKNRVEENEELYTYVGQQKMPEVLKV